MTTFRELLEGSTIFRGIIATTVLGTLAYCVVNTITPPDWWIAIGSGVIAFYFAGSISNQVARNTVKAQEAVRRQ